jgi:hypothetical protein
MNTCYICKKTIPDIYKAYELSAQGPAGPPEYLGKWICQTCVDFFLAKKNLSSRS